MIFDGEDESARGNHVGKGRRERLGSTILWSIMPTEALRGTDIVLGDAVVICSMQKLIPLIRPARSRLYGLLPLV